MSDKDINTEEELHNDEAQTVENETAKGEPEVVVEEPKEITAEEKIAELEGRLLRKQADFDNYRKRALKDLDSARFNAKISAVEEFIPLYDNFKMAMMACNVENPDINTILVGMNMIQSAFEKALSDLGVEEENAVGKVFNPHFHEAVAHKISEDVAEGTIISQQRSGFHVGERLIRPATVIVSSGPEKESEEESGSEEEGSDV